MNLYPIAFQEALNEIRPMEKWVETIQDIFLKKEMDVDKIKVSYHWGFFVKPPKGMDKNEFYNSLYTKYEFMEYPERLDEELSKVRVNIVIEYGKFILSNRLEEIPSDIVIIITELTKIKMLNEGKEHGNKNTIDSIPEIDKTIIGYEEISFEDGDDDIKMIGAPDPIRNIDDVLDKIFEHGIESLTVEEREFLKNQGK